MLRLLTLALLLAAGAGSAAHAQTGKKPAPAKPRAMPTKPRPAPAAKPTSDGQGEYVAPGMTGAPDDKVTTDYENRPLKKPAANTSTMSSQPAPKKKP